MQEIRIINKQLVIINQNLKKKGKSESAFVRERY